MNKSTMLVLGLAAAGGGGYFLSRPTEGSLRRKVVSAALSQEGASDPSPYWRDTIGAGPWPKSWCGAFALWALHQAGLARQVKWWVGKGFLYRLPVTTKPKIGDIAYFTTNQHHAVVVGVNGDSIQIVNGNGLGGKVTVSTTTRAAVTAFYSIVPLLMGVL